MNRTDRLAAALDRALDALAAHETTHTVAAHDPCTDLACSVCDAATLARALVHVLGTLPGVVTGPALDGLSEPRRAAFERVMGRDTPTEASVRQ